MIILCIVDPFPDSSGGSLLGFSDGTFYTDTTGFTG